MVEVLPARSEYNPDAPIVIEYAYITPAHPITPKKRIRDTHDNVNIPTPMSRGPLLPLSVLIQQPWPSEPTFLAAMNPHPFDWRVKFNADTHTYIVTYSHNDPYPSELNLSVSTWVKQQFPEFNEDKVIGRMRK